MQGEPVTPKKVRLAACVSTKSVELNIVTFRLVTRSQHIIPSAPLTYFNDGGGRGGSEWFFWVWHFGQKGFFGVYKRRRDFLFGSRKKNRGIFWGCEKRTKEFLGMIKKKVVIFLAGQILKLWIFGYKIWTCVGPPLPLPPPLHRH